MRKLMTGTIAFLAGGAAVLLLLELVLRVMPVREGGYAAEPAVAWPAHTLIASSNYTYSIGWNMNNVHHGHINNFGYVSPFDYQDGSSGVAVIGDSFIESMMNEYSETLQGVLTRELRSPQQVMNFGLSGAGLAHYLGTAQLIGRHFTPSWVVVVITAGDYSGSFSTEPGYYRWAPESDPPIKLVPEIHRSSMTQFVRSLALVRYIRGNIAIRFGDLIHVQRAHDGAPKCAYTKLSKEDEQITAKFADALPRVLRLPSGHVILVFDSDRKALYAGTPPAAAMRCPNIDQLARTRLMQLASADGMHVIDSGPIFRDYYAATHEHLDFLPQDGHWNANAHGLIAHAVADVINGAPPPARGSILSLAQGATEHNAKP